MHETQPRDYGVKLSHLAECLSFMTIHTEFTFTEKHYVALALAIIQGVLDIVDNVTKEKLGMCYSKL